MADDERLGQRADRSASGSRFARPAEKPGDFDGAAADARRARESAGVVSPNVLPQETIRETPKDSWTRAYIHVTLEIYGQNITSTLGPIECDEGWAVFQAFLADMRRLNPSV